MRFSIILAGATAVTAVSLPDFVKRQAQKVDLSQFQTHKFPLLDPQVAAAQVASNNANFDPALVPTALPTPSPAPGNFRIAAAQATCTNPRIRIEWRSLSEQQKVAYVNAVKCLQRAPKKLQSLPSKNRLEDLTAVHQKFVSSIHGVGKFLPWHRYFLYTFESLLRDECGYTGPMTWWDETKDAGRFAQAPVFSSTTFGSGPLKTGNQGTCITNGVFANTVLNIGPGTSNQPHCLSRAIDENLTRQVTSSFVNSCNSNNNYTAMQNCQYTGPHAYGHNGVGAVMTDVASSVGDPLFYLHHAFVDRNWRIWQNADPNGRKFQVNGPITDNGAGTTTLDTQLLMNGIKPDIPLRNVMDTLGGFLCYRYDY